MPRPHIWFQPSAITGTGWADTYGRATMAVDRGTASVVDVPAGHGSQVPVRALEGTTATRLSFGSVIASMFTICSTTRYSGASRKRILQGSSNWLHGHWNGRAGVAWYGGWKGPANNKLTLLKKYSPV